MGVDIALYVAPKDGRRLSREGFTALITDLIASQIAAPPCVLVQGRSVKANDPDGMWWDVRSGRAPNTLWRGKRSSGLLAALAAAPYGKQQLAVAFEGLWSKNSTLMRQLEQAAPRGGRHMGLIAYALKKPTDVELEDFDSPDPPQRLKVQHFVALWGRSGVEDIREVPALKAVLERHFGSLVSRCSAS